MPDPSRHHGGGPPTALEAGEAEFEPIPKSAHVPGLIIIAAIWLAWLTHSAAQMRDWGLSAAALAEGRYDTIILHMFAHGGLMHIGFNSVVLLSLAGPLMTWMGTPPASWLRFYSAYLLAGLTGAAVYLLLNPDGAVPMIGASGAIYGLLGMALRLQGDQERLVPIFSAAMARRLWDFLKANIWLLVLLSIPFLLSGSGGGIAWEAHLGGFLAGFVAAPLFLVQARG